MRRGLLCVLMLLLASVPLGEQRAPVANWSFEQGGDGDEVRGFRSFVPGVAGTGLRFDGQTTTVIRKAARMGRLGPAFWVEAWVAIQEYPWTWCAIANQERAHKAGYFFGIDPEGRFGLQLAVNGGWLESQSDIKLPLYAWNHLVAAFDPATGVKLYWNGKLVGSKAAKGRPTLAPAVDAWVGRNHTPLGLIHEVKIVAPVAFSFNGIIDELRVHNGVAAASDVEAAFARVTPSGSAPLAPPVIPAGPKGPGRFGAYYTRLKYADEWENPWGVGDAADVVVRFRFSRRRAEPVIRSFSNQEDIAKWPERPENWLERIWAPEVRMYGRMAIVTAPYDFYRDGKFSHFGVDVFELLETGDGWRIAGVLYTVQRESCPPSPLGPPKFDHQPAVAR